MAERTATEGPGALVPSEKQGWQRIVTALRRLLDGKSNNVGDFALAVAPATTTDLVSPLITANSAVFVSPTNALAAAEPGMPVSYPAANTARFTHTANAGARTFRYAVVG